MNKIAFILIIAFSSFRSYCNTDTTHAFFLNTLSVSVNRTNVQDNNTANRFGYGFGIYHLGKTDKEATFMFGFEYNITNQFKNYEVLGNLSEASNITYTIGDFAIAMGLRFNLVRHHEKIFFIESGISFDNVVAEGKGTVHIDQTSQPSQTYIGSVDEANANNLGLRIGIGLSIPISKYKLIIEPDYKFESGSINTNTGLTYLYNNYFRLMLQLKFL